MRAIAPHLLLPSRPSLRLIQTVHTYSFFGLILVTHSDSLLASVSTTLPDPTAHVKRPMWGDALALLSAFCYAIYVILLKVRIGDEERVDMQLFFG